MKAIIFGINAQDGYYLAELLINKNISVIGIGRTPTLNVLVGDVKDYVFVEKLIKTHQPNYIFHLAANSTTHHEALFENHETISTGTINILEAVYKYSMHSKVFLSGSAVQFENNGLPIDEKTPFSPLSPYAIARIQSVFAARYFRKLGLNVYFGYFFKHDSPLRTERHINQKIAMAVKRIANGSKEIIEIGDISVRKEFNFAKDFMEAIWLFVNQTNEFEVVIGSGKDYSIKDWLSICFKSINKDYTKFVIEKQSFKSEYNVLVSNPKLLFSFGYNPKTDIINLAELMLK